MKLRRRAAGTADTAYPFVIGAALSVSSFLLMAHRCRWPTAHQLSLLDHCGHTAALFDFVTCCPAYPLPNYAGIKPRRQNAYLTRVPLSVRAARVRTARCSRPGRFHEAIRQLYPHRLASRSAVAWLPIASTRPALTTRTPPAIGRNAPFASSPRNAPVTRRWPGT